MDTTFSLGATVQAVDQIGQWERGTIASFGKKGYVVRWDGWGKEWDVEVLPSELRLPVKNRRSKYLFPVVFNNTFFSLQPSRIHRYNRASLSDILFHEHAETAGR